jgi:hypothetical protein
MTEFPYVTNLDVKFQHFEVIDIPTLAKECKDKWFNQTLTRVNDSVVRIGIVQGEYHWHKHDNDDEFFFVLEGQLLNQRYPTDRGLATNFSLMEQREQESSTFWTAPDLQGLQLLSATFVTHSFPRHLHDTYVLARN